MHSTVAALTPTGGEVTDGIMQRETEQKTEMSMGNMEQGKEAHTEQN